MHKNKGSKYRNKSKPAVGDKARETLENIDDNNPVIQLFKGYAAELDDKHDRYERIVKLSRDCTIESKRIIFLLHNVNTDIESKRVTVLNEAQERLNALINTHFKSIALELKGHDSYLYTRAYTSGVQEFIEAYTFYQFILSENIGDWKSFDALFKYSDEENGEFSLLFTQNDYILGLGDLTGELMRRCINTLGVGNTSECFKLCNYVKAINTGFIGLIAPGNKELGRKAYTLRQSLSKMELVCYNIQIRGQEIPKHMLMSVIESSDVKDDDDEGYY
ncbi:unnamed protein product [Brassicogethes aeneus]|uniref:Translin-associated protein X n=1 Tax=Brassicogethes aeneus TaxID=1431903 RepID=A0A9P0FE69_BRAAE|nr:unnamed protein product [Brassicogethes aeneus]